MTTATFARAIRAFSSAAFSVIVLGDTDGTPQGRGERRGTAPHTPHPAPDGRGPAVTRTD